MIFLFLCFAIIKASNTIDPTNPPDDSDEKEKKISKYLYIGIGSAAGAIVLGIIIFLIFRIAGKCSKLERKSTDEGLELEERRTTYLLQDGEQGEEIIPKDQENSHKDEENQLKEGEKNDDEL